MDNLSEELSRTLGTTMRSLARLVALELDRSELGIRLPQFGVLDFLLTNSRAVQTDLANHFAKDKSAMLRQMDEMEEAGWIERQMDPEDRRRKHLMVTKSGMEVYRKASRIRAKVFAKALDGVSHRDLEVCLRVLVRMNELANAQDAQ